MFISCYKKMLTYATPLLFIACGGSAEQKTTDTAKDYQNLCESPRTGIDPFTQAAYPDKKGSLLSEKTFIRKWMDEDYLWYKELPQNIDLNNSLYPNARALFDALKVPQDRFHYWSTTEAHNAHYAGENIDYGFDLALDPITRAIYVRYVIPSTPAAQAGFLRGDVITRINGDNRISSIAYDLNNPIPGKNYLFEVSRVINNATETHTLAITPNAYASDPVPLYKTIVNGSNTIGYVVFTEHIDNADIKLSNTFQALKKQGVNQLVLDMRYNGGGYIYIASALAYMVAGDKHLGKIFGKLQFNDKVMPTLKNDRTTFTVNEKSWDGSTLTTLNLPEITILTSEDTCSASEAVINGLRGIGVNVNLIGGQTCGKPYGFQTVDNCGYSYSAINFQISNAKNESDYQQGFTPLCSVADDLSKPLGDLNEAQLKTALYFINNRQCPTSTTQASAKTRGANGNGVAFNQSPYRYNMQLR